MMKITIERWEDDEFVLCLDGKPFSTAASKRTLESVSPFIEEFRREIQEMGISKRYGKIQISSDVESLVGFWSNVKGIVPLEVYHSLTPRIKIYTCISEHFRELSEGENIPTYLILFKRTNLNELYIESIEEIGVI